MKTRGPALALVASAMFLAAACSGHLHKASTVSVASSEAPTTASATVTAYYGALAQHDSTQAASLLDPALRQELTASPDSDLHNVARLSPLRDLRVSPAALPSGLPGGYTDITQVFVSYDVVYKHVVASENGPNSRFLYLGKDAQSGDWRILAIGTGP